MKFEEALQPTLYNTHPYNPADRWTLVHKAQKQKKKKDMNEEFAASSFAATGKQDVQGVQKRIQYTDNYGKRKKIVRRKFPKPVSINSIRS